MWLPENSGMREPSSHGNWAGSYVFWRPCLLFLQSVPPGSGPHLQPKGVYLVTVAISWRQQLTWEADALLRAVCHVFQTKPWHIESIISEPLSCSMLLSLITNRTCFAHTPQTPLYPSHILWASTCSMLLWEYHCSLTWWHNSCGFLFWNCVLCYSLKIQWESCFLKTLNL